MVAAAASQPWRFIFLCLAWSAAPLTRVQAQSSSSSGDKFWIRLGDNTPGGTQVGSLSNHPILRNHSDSASRQNRTFGIIAISSDGAQYFRVESATGSIFTAKQIDRDDLCSDSRLCCENDMVCTFSFRALVNIGKTQLMPSVFVSLADQNDNAPKFAASNIVLDVLESTEPRGAYRSYEMRLPPATDLDSKNYSIRDYRLITNDPSKFALRKPQSLTDPSEMLVLLIREPLDREEQDKYQMTIVAHDGGQPPLSSSMSVVIHVRDANDHQPIFHNKTYSVSIPETFSVGDVVVQLNATDKDDGENGRVMYEFDQSVSDDIRRRFLLDGNTGTLRLDSPLDFEAQRLYRFVVLAHDAVEPAKFDKATVTISVTDVNDEYPAIDISTLDEAAQTPESARLGTIVMYMKVMDKEGFAGNCTIDNPRFGLELLDSNRQAGSRGYEYNIVTRQPLDRERLHATNGVERMRIRCTDSFNEHSLESVKDVNLTIADVNDNAPVFHPSSLEISVNENNNPYDPIGQLLAEDADAAENSQVRFQFATPSTPAQNAFRLDSESGQLFSLRALDREDKARYVLPVIAYDLGNPSMTATATVTISVIDQNDNAPSFEPKTFEFSVAEHERPGTYVGQVRATDADDPKVGGTISYSISPSSGAPFTIGRHDGIIFTDQELNREMRDHYVFHVVATDNSDPQQSASVLVTVRVSDKNDHSPRIHYPLGVNTTFYVSCTEQLYYCIMTINASDEDLDRNRELRYSILSGDPGLFHIDPELGSLRLNRALTERDCGRSEKLTIEVRDSGSPSLRTEANLQVIFDRTLRPSKGDSSGSLSRKPGLPKPPGSSQNDEARHEEELDSTVETLLLVVVFAVLIVMLIVTFVVIFMSRRQSLSIPWCKLCLGSQTNNYANRNRKRETRNRRHRRPNEGDKRNAANRDSNLSVPDDHAATIAALLSSEAGDQPVVFNSDRTYTRNQAPYLCNETELSMAKHENDDNNNNQKERRTTCTLPKQKRNRSRAANYTSSLTVHRNARETVAAKGCEVDTDGSPTAVCSEKYDCTQVMAVNEMHPAEALASNFYLPADRMHIYSGEDETEMRENSFAHDNGTPIKLIPLEGAVSPDGFVMCNPQSINYGTCSSCSDTPHLEAGILSRTLINNAHIASPLRYTPRNATAITDYSAACLRSKSATMTPVKAFPKIESSMI